MTTPLEDRISDIVSSVIVNLKAKGTDNLSVHKIVNYINDRYNVLLDDDIVKNVLSSTAGVAEINDDKVLIGKAPDDEAEAQGAVEQGKKTFKDQSVGGMGSGAPMGGDMGGMPEGEDMPTDDSSDGDLGGDIAGSTENPDMNTDDDSADDMDAQLSELDV